MATLGAVCASLTGAARRDRLLRYGGVALLGSLAVLIPVGPIASLVAALARIVGLLLIGAVPLVGRRARRTTGAFALLGVCVLLELGSLSALVRGQAWGLILTTRLLAASALLLLVRQLELPEGRVAPAGDASEPPAARAPTQRSLAALSPTTRVSVALLLGLLACVAGLGVFPPTVACLLLAIEATALVLLVRLHPGDPPAFGGSGLIAAGSHLSLAIAGTSSLAALASAIRGFTPSMAQPLALCALFALALVAAGVTLVTRGPGPPRGGAVPNPDGADDQEI